MTVGRNAVRRLLKSESQWRDKGAQRHKHRYCTPTIVVLEHGDTGNITYHEVMKCSECNSFNSIVRPGSVDGFIQDISRYNLSSYYILRMYTPHRWIIGWTDAIVKST